jgi:hypothetical protein
MMDKPLNLLAVVRSLTNRTRKIAETQGVDEMTAFTMMLEQAEREDEPLSSVLEEGERIIQSGVIDPKDVDDYA